ncbi:MAG: cysteine synthase A [Spirochaetia bacterium]|nr:cysteine synthase A [Spirochaetia bacterium]
MNVFSDNSQSIGRTPLVRLNRVTEGCEAEIYAKIEGRNPSYSVKCRIGAAMIWEAEKKNLLKPGMEVIEPTSGNTGIALAYVCSAKGYKLTLTMPESMSIERRKILKAFGASIILTDASQGMKGAILAAHEIATKDPDHFFLPEQFSNPANPEVHEKTTGPEIWDDLEGNIDIFVSGVGTGGTITGVSRFLKKTKNKEIISVAVEPENSPVITQSLNGLEIIPGPHKIQGIGAGFIPDVLDLDLIDRVETVSNEESIEMSRKLAMEEGILSGISCGAAAVAAIRIGRLKSSKGKNIVVIFPDSGERYLSSILFDNYFSNIENASASSSII